MKTKSPSKMGSPMCPDRLAKWYAPSPKAPASNVVNVLFKTFPRVTPEKCDQKRSQRRSDY